MVGETPARYRRRDLRLLELSRSSSTNWLEYSVLAKRNQSAMIRMERRRLHRLAHAYLAIPSTCTHWDLAPRVTNFLRSAAMSHLWRAPTAAISQSLPKAAEAIAESLSICQRRSKHAWPPRRGLGRRGPEKCSRVPRQCTRGTRGPLFSMSSTLSFSAWSAG